MALIVSSSSSTDIPERPKASSGHTSLEAGREEGREGKEEREGGKEGREGREGGREGGREKRRGRER